MGGSGGGERWGWGWGWEERQQAGCRDERGAKALCSGQSYSKEGPTTSSMISRTFYMGLTRHIVSHSIYIDGCIFGYFTQYTYVSLCTGSWVRRPARSLPQSGTALTPVPSSNRFACQRTVLCDGLGNDIAGRHGVGRYALKLYF